MVAHDLTRWRHYDCECNATVAVLTNLGRRYSADCFCRLCNDACCPRRDWCWQWMCALAVFKRSLLTPHSVLTSTVPAYQSECAPPHQRGMLVLVEGSLITFGEFKAFVFRCFSFHLFLPDMD